MPSQTPFENLIVIDFTHVLAGPACAYYLGLLGAKVIKVESPEKGDAIRHRGGTDTKAAQKGMSTSFLTQAGGKQSVTLDLDTSEGLAGFHELLAQADILIENHKPETMRRLGLDEESLCASYPDLIYCAMTGYGRGGPQENSTAYDVNIQAACGLMDATGTRESGPIRTGAPILDYATALSASFAISAALYKRSQTGQGSFVDVSMLETGLALMSSTITDYYYTGNAPQRRGNLANSRSPGAGSFACREGILSLGVNEEAHFIALAHGFDRQDWLADDRFSDKQNRKENASALVDEIEAELRKKTANEWEVLLQEAGVPCAALRSLPEALASPQVQKRGFVQSLPDGTKVPTLPFRLNNGGPFSPICDAPSLGQDTQAVKNWLANQKTKS